MRPLRPSIRLLWAVPLCALAACEEVVLPDTPGEPGEAPAFTIVQIETVSPASGSTFTPNSGPQSFEVRVFYQRSAADVAEQATWPVFAWAETWRGPVGNALWGGDLASGGTIIDDELGDLTLSGTFTLPSVSPFCSRYDRLRAITVVAAPQDPGQGQIPRSGLSTKEDLSSNVGIENFAVTGVPAPTRPCVIDLESVVEFDDFEFFWGEPVWIWGQRLPGANSPTVRFTGGEEISFTLRQPDDSTFGSWDLVQTWIPSRAQTGSIRVLYDNIETAYGGDVRPSIEIGGQFDYFEPNDDWRDASSDPIFWGDDTGWAINPGLTIDNIDQQSDGTANPFGFTGWGVGDWWSFDVPRPMCIQVFVFMESGDDLDLFLTDGNGNAITSDLSVGGTTASVRDSVSAGSGRVERRLWVAPWDVTSQFSRFRLWIVNCALLESPEMAEALAAVAERDQVGYLTPDEWTEEALVALKRRHIELAGPADTRGDGVLLRALERARPLAISPERRARAERHWAQTPTRPPLGALRSGPPDLRDRDDRVLARRARGGAR